MEEYVEPGRSATEMSKRAAFQRLLARIRNSGDIDHVIVYKLSRLARNRVDDAIVMADLRQHGVTLISATESVDDTPVGQLMHGILATFNEYQSRESGADIAYKMGQKARNGGTIGRARLGYLNHIDRTDGREIRTVIVDPERAPLVRLGFELFAAGNLTIEQLSDKLCQRGLRTRPTTRYPPQRVSVSKLSRMLRDRYYLGYVAYSGEEFPGRHEPLIDQVLFERVQVVLKARTATTERRRVHHHYLKGILHCGHCHQTGTTGRMIIQHTVTRRGDEYTYFFCRNRQQGICPAPYINVTVAEKAVERYYTAISQQRITVALATLTAGVTGDHNPSWTRNGVQDYQTCTADYSTTHSSSDSASLRTTSPTTNCGRQRPSKHQPVGPKHPYGTTTQEQAPTSKDPPAHAASERIT
ncbi:DNA invertase Pin-like site-specific DNA recombinase [Kibdelosporangium banguiense]|uniref:DNA invertase Pin-like site-specific DNA recombinase n=1 Tax=Kibdelosporangium banguiense TaxID=1365924 RepID=A0ABS4T7W4_9PSEU|nr:recombinase family protein [Kibdelosporangium banguiense]MBP2320517.1 DNA invertase Pin-like site-specific DNA recombinase [Kibdelosporangium banguiense]